MTTSTPRSSLRLLDLPADVWGLVAAYLPPDGVLYRLCRHFPAPGAAADVLLPSHVDASADARLLMRCSPALAWTRRLVTLVLHDTYWAPRAWQEWTEALPVATLQSLKLRRCNVPWDALQRLAERVGGHRLHTLWIEEVLNVNAVTLPLPPDIGQWIAALVPAADTDDKSALRSLSLAHNDLVLGAGPLRALLALPGLEELRLMGNYAYWTDDLRMGPALRRVGLATNPSTGIGPAALLGTLTRPLEALALQYEVMPQPCMCRHILGFAPLTASPSLRTLRIRGSVVAFGGSWEATCEALRDLLRACPALETLDLGDSVVNTSFVTTVFQEAGPALRCFRAGLCMVNSWAPDPRAPLRPRQDLRTFRTYWNLPAGVLDTLHGLVDLDLAHLTQTRGLYRTLQRNARTLRRLRLDHAMLSGTEAFMCGRALAAQCRNLDELSTRHWSAESTRELMHGILMEPARATFRALRQWHYVTVYMDARLLRLLHRVLARCPRLERYQHVRVQGAGGAAGVTGAATMRWEPALRVPTTLRVWDFSATDMDSADVKRMLACLAAGASPWLREWRLDHNPEIKDGAFVDFAQCWGSRPPDQRERLRVLSLKDTGMTCAGLYFVHHLRLRVLQVLAALSTSYLLEAWLMSLLHARSLVTEQVRLPFALHGTVDPDILHRLQLRGTQVLPFELVD